MANDKWRDDDRRRDHQGQGGRRPPRPAKNTSMDPGPPGEQKTGLIKRLVPDRGFGFIRSDNGQEWFFHRSACKGNARYDDLCEQDAVTFVAGQTSDKGLRAEMVDLALRNTIEG